MIPILSGIIVGQGDKRDALRGFSLAFTYVQGMALTYAAAGAIFVLAFKQAPQAFFQQPWIIVPVRRCCSSRSRSRCSAPTTLQLPSALQTRLTDVSNQQKSGTYIGTFIMGALSALVVTACVAPAIIAALSVISQSGQIARGAAALYATGLGMGVPLLIVGASAGSLLPKVGPWMDTVKQLFGVLFLGVAIYLLTAAAARRADRCCCGRRSPSITGFWIFSLKARDGAPAPAPVRAIGLIAIVYGVLLLIGAASGSHDPLQPLDRLRGARGLGSCAQTHELAFQRIKTVDDLERAVAAASAAGKPVMLDFYADWCVSCKEMEKYTFTDRGVQAAARERRPAAGRRHRKRRRRPGAAQALRDLRPADDRVLRRRWRRAQELQAGRIRRPRNASATTSLQRLRSSYGLEDVDDVSSRRRDQANRSAASRLTAADFKRMKTIVYVAVALLAALRASRIYRFAIAPAGRSESAATQPSAVATTAKPTPKRTRPDVLPDFTLADLDGSSALDPQLARTSR